MKKVGSSSVTFYTSPRLWFILSFFMFSPLYLSCLISLVHWLLSFSLLNYFSLFLSSFSFFLLYGRFSESVQSSEKLAEWDMGLNLPITVRLMFSGLFTANFPLHLFTINFYIIYNYNCNISYHLQTWVKHVPFCTSKQLLKRTATNLTSSMILAYKILSLTFKYAWRVSNHITIPITIPYPCKLGSHTVLRCFHME